MKINKGDKFICVKKFVIECGSITYKKGFKYYSYMDGYITNEESPRWVEISDYLKKNFVKLKN
jgi:hypothetical protein